MIIITMIYKLTFIYLMSFISIVYSNCFTMPPKVTKFSKWALSVPNVESKHYIHDTYNCPADYELDSQYSHIDTTLIKNNINNINIYGYSLCCKKSNVKELQVFSKKIINSIPNILEPFNDFSLFPNQCNNK